MRARPRLIALLVLVVSLDQATKLLVASRLTLGESIPIIPGLLHFTLVRNSGMAFGLFASTAVPYKHLLVTLLSVLALVAVAVYTLRSPANERLSQVGLTLILGGAAGNILDRLRLGYVVDFIDAFYRGSHWPAFNLADSAICVGVGLLLLDTLLRRESAPAPAGGGGASSTGDVECIPSSSISEK
ncbi:MAG: signal peptidase II [Acidobacteria bacterium]|nr:signal peptidase II [Acidobacteriota bacterium]